MAAIPAAIPGSMVEQIVVGAEKAFLAGGYEATSMDSIARQAGVARASVYNNFATKDVLFLAVMRRGIERFVDRALAGDDPALEPWDRLHSVASSFLREACETEAIEMYRVVVAQGSRFPELSKTLSGRGLKRIETRFRELATLVGDRVVDPSRFAGQLLAILMGGPFSAQLLGVAARPGDRAISTSVERAIAALASPVRRPPASAHASSRA